MYIMDRDLGLDIIGYWINKVKYDMDLIVGIKLSEVRLMQNKEYLRNIILFYLLVYVILYNYYYQRPH